MEYFDYVWWFFGGLAGAVVLFLGQLLTFGRVVGTIGSFLYTFLTKSLQMKWVRQTIDFRRLPDVIRAKTLRGHREEALNLCVRLKEYLSVRRYKKADREGPYAIQQMLEDSFDPNFQRWQQVLKDMKAEFDRLEERVNQILHQLRWRTHEATKFSQQAIDKREPALALIKIRYARATFKLRRMRTLRGLRKQFSLVMRCRKRMKRQQKDYNKWVRARDRKVRELEILCDLELGPYLDRLNDFEKRNLQANVPVFQADWASAQMTVEIGRTLGRLMDKRNPLNAGVRKMFKLEHLPYDLAEMREMMANDLRGRVGMNPNWHDEDMFETWVRVYYHELGPDKCPDGADLLGGASFHLWVGQLVPPGEKGLAHQQYGHLGQQGAMGWLVPPPSIAKTAPVEVAA